MFDFIEHLFLRHVSTRAFSEFSVLFDSSFSLSMLPFPGGERREAEECEKAYARISIPYVTFDLLV